MAQFRSKPFGVTKSGEKVNEYIISNPGGLEVHVLNYGCVIKNILVPTKKGPVDVVIGHDTLADYENDFNSQGSTCCGAFVGRYANRIENAVFSVGGRAYHLEANNGKNHLHGTFPRKIYEVKSFGDTLLLEAESPDGEDGFPGNLKISVRYILTEDNALRMDYRVSSDADTVLNLTNHTYFNLDGERRCAEPEAQALRVPVSGGQQRDLPHRQHPAVAGTPMDFTSGKPLGRDIDTGFSQTTMVGGGFDHCFVIDRDRGSSQSLCAWATSEKSGISMKMYTTQPGIQLYTGNFLQDCPTPGKGGVPLQKYGGFALETQHFPCSPSHPEFPTHHPPRGQGLPRQHHAAFLHRTPVRTPLKRENGMTARPGGHFCVPGDLSLICTKSVFPPWAGCKKICGSIIARKKMQQESSRIKWAVLDSVCKKRYSLGSRGKALTKNATMVTRERFLQWQFWFPAALATLAATPALNC